ncbi:MAG: serine protease [Cucumibacter sp.]
MTTALIWFGLLHAAVAAPRLADAFSPLAFTPEELGIIQRSLTFLGHYEGLWDKEWGAASALALQDYARERWSESHANNAVVLSAILEATHISDNIGWSEIPLKEWGVSFGVPENHVQLNETRTDLIEFSGADLLVRVWWDDAWNLERLHEGIVRGLPVAQTYTVRRTARWVSSAQTLGKWSYLRSDLIDAGWVSIYVEGSSDVETLFRYVVSSFDTSPDFDINDGDLTNVPALLEEAAALQDDDSPATRVPNEDLRERQSSTGTGFFVTDSLVVSNWHVVEGCGALRGPGGMQLDLIGEDREEDLALLRSNGRSSAFLSITPTAEVLLGEEVSALGFPLYGMLNQQLNFTSGVVSAIFGLGDDPDQFTLTAPLQPGNSGGPILNRNGQVVGVAVAFADASYWAAEFDFVPQNINWAIDASTLRSFLDANDVPYSTTAIPVDTSAGVPVQIQRAVIPIVCDGADQSSLGISERAGTATCNGFVATLRKTEADAEARLVLFDHGIRRGKAD